MPLQNRVRPTGEIVAESWRGHMMGNRGCLHGGGRTLGTARWRSKLWICCVLEWRGWKRDPMPPHRWTALFFLDEASALSAGHRPCAYCRRDDYLTFAHAWQAAERADRRPWAKEMDYVLHSQRVDRTRRKRTHTASVRNLPDGVMVLVDDAVHLKAAGRLLRWTPAGYAASKRPPSIDVQVLTPPAIVGAIAAGYQPWCHPSAGDVGGNLRIHGRPVG